MDTSEIERVARGLSAGARDMVLCGWQGASLIAEPIVELNEKELMHLDIMKAENGNIHRWRARLTELGTAVRDHLNSGGGNAPSGGVVGGGRDE